MANDTFTQTTSDDMHVGHAAHSAHDATSISEALTLADAFCLRQGEKLTPIRRKVLELLLTSGRATKAYTLLDEMRKIHPGSAPPTVYRALDFLLNLGLVHRVESINAFAACHDLTHCHHGMLLVCQRCGAVSEMHEPEIERVLLDKIKRSGYRLSSDAAELKGVCPDCQTAEALAAGDVTADGAGSSAAESSARASYGRTSNAAGQHADHHSHSHDPLKQNGRPKQPA